MAVFLLYFAKFVGKVIKFLQIIDTFLRIFIDFFCFLCPIKILFVD